MDVHPDDALDIVTQPVPCVVAAGERRMQDGIGDRVKQLGAADRGVEEADGVIVRGSVFEEFDVEEVGGEYGDRVGEDDADDAGRSAALVVCRIARHRIASARISFLKDENAVGTLLAQRPETRTVSQ